MEAYNRRIYIMVDTRSILLCAVIVSMTDKLRNVRADCVSDLANITEPALTIQENSIAGTTILPITTDFNNLIFSTTGSGGFLNITNGSFVIATNVSLDGPQNQVACTNRQTQPTWTIYCNGDTTSKKVMNILIALTDDFGPYFTDTLPVANVSEDAAVGSSIIDLETIVGDDDCSTTFNFFIDDTSKQVFKLNLNNLILGQALDYEKQKDYYINLTVMSSIENGQEAFYNTTILKVQVLDVDDMNPIFDVTQFLLLVPEAQVCSLEIFILFLSVF
ncbi:hypothetical protein BsWGS_12594 [Bradybaena similaris]